MVTLCTMKRVLLGPPQSERHSIGDHNIRQKYGRIYSAHVQNGSVFAAVFVRITTCNILQMHTGKAHTFPLNMSSGLGRHPLMFSQCAPSLGGTFVFGAQPPLHFIDQLQDR